MLITLAWGNGSVMSQAYNLIVCVIGIFCKLLQCKLSYVKLAMDRQHEKSILKIFLSPEHGTGYIMTIIVRNSLKQLTTKFVARATV